MGESKRTYFYGTLVEYLWLEEGATNVRQEEVINVYDTYGDAEKNLERDKNSVLEKAEDFKAKTKISVYISIKRAEVIQMQNRIEEV